MNEIEELKKRVSDLENYIFKQQNYREEPIIKEKKRESPTARKMTPINNDIKKENNIDLYENIYENYLPIIFFMLLAYFLMFVSMLK